MLVAYPFHAHTAGTQRVKQYATSFLLVLVLYAPAILGSPDSIGANVEVLGLSQDRAFVRINGQQHVMRAGGKSQG